MYKPLALVAPELLRQYLAMLLRGLQFWPEVAGPLPGRQNGKADTPAASGFGRYGPIPAVA